VTSRATIHREARRAEALGYLHARPTPHGFTSIWVPPGGGAVTPDSVPGTHASWLREEFRPQASIDYDAIEAATARCTLADLRAWLEGRGHFVATSSKRRSLSMLVQIYKYRELWPYKLDEKEAA
jgi:hypothetical protein